MSVDVVFSLIVQILILILLLRIKSLIPIRRTLRNYSNASDKQKILLASLYEHELSRYFPDDFKDWHQNDVFEHPEIVLEALNRRDRLIAQYEEWLELRHAGPLQPDEAEHGTT